MHNKVDKYQSDFRGETLAKGGGTLTPKNRDFAGIKLQIFGAEGAENFEKCRVFKEKWAILEF